MHPFLSYLPVQANRQSPQVHSDELSHRPTTVVVRFARHAGRVPYVAVVLAAVVQLAELPQDALAARCDRPRPTAPGTIPAIMATPGKVAKTGTAAASSRGGCRTGPPSYWPRMASPPSPRRAEPVFQRTRDAACRRSMRQPRGGLSRTGPGTTQPRTAMPPAGSAEWQGKRRR